MSTIDPTNQNYAAAYLADRLGVRPDLSASFSSVDTSPSGSAEGDVVSISDSSNTSFLILRDTIDARHSEVAVVQIANSDLETLSFYLGQIRGAYINLSNQTNGTSEFETARSLLVELESEMSQFIGARSTLTTDIAQVTTEYEQESVQYLSFSNLPVPDPSSQGDLALNTFAILEVDLGEYLNGKHQASTCPICAALSASEGNATGGSTFTGLIANDANSLNEDMLSADALPANEAPATYTSNVTGATTSTASSDSYVEALRAGPIWDISAGETLSYSYYTGIVPYDGTAYSTAAPYNAPVGASAISVGNQSLLDQAFNAWDLALSFDFEKVTESGSTVGELRSAYTTRPYASAGSAAYAYYPNSSVLGGDIWYINDQATNLDFTPGTYGYLTALHEIGHALGFSHSFDGSSATGTNLSSADDIQRNTVMTYTQIDRNKYFYLSSDNRTRYTGYFYASTPGVYDVATAEYLYGAVTDANLGNTTYRWATNPRVIETLIDSGGTDTIDASNQTRASVIDLTPGSFSSIGIFSAVDQVAYYSNLGFLTTDTTDLYTGEDNIGIAFSATIENAIGGSGDDTITGNTANNTLKGNAGNDTVDGGAGADVAEFSGNFANYTISTSGGVTTVTDNVGTDGTDTITNVEELQFADLSYVVSTGLTSSSAASGGGGSLSASSSSSSASSSGGGRALGATIGAAHGMGAVNVKTASDASRMLKAIDLALEVVLQQRSKIGAVMNMLDRRASVLATTLVNTESSRSRIMDTDYATETAVVARKMILIRAGHEVLKQSNLSSGLVMDLLRY